jgi:hypothetical protein
LVGIANELVDKYKDKGVFGSVLAKEPLTGVKKVELEHLVQEYGDKIEEHGIEEQSN